MTEDHRFKFRPDVPSVDGITEMKILEDGETSSTNEEPDSVDPGLEFLKADMEDILKKREQREISDKKENSEASVDRRENKYPPDKETRFLKRSTNGELISYFLGRGIADKFLDEESDFEDQKQLSKDLLKIAEQKAKRFWELKSGADPKPEDQTLLNISQKDLDILLERGKINASLSRDPEEKAKQEIFLKETEGIFSDEEDQQKQALEFFDRYKNHSDISTERSAQIGDGKEIRGGSDSEKKVDLKPQVVGRKRRSAIVPNASKTPLPEEDDPMFGRNTNRQKQAIAESEKIGKPVDYGRLVNPPLSERDKAFFKAVSEEGVTEENLVRNGDKSDTNSGGFGIVDDMSQEKQPQPPEVASKESKSENLGDKLKPHKYDDLIERAENNTETGIGSQVEDLQISIGHGDPEIIADSSDEESKNPSEKEAPLVGGQGELENPDSQEDGEAKAMEEIKGKLGLTIGDFLLIENNGLYTKYEFYTIGEKDGLVLYLRNTNNPQDIEVIPFIDMEEDLKTGKIKKVSIIKEIKGKGEEMPQKKEELPPVVEEDRLKTQSPEEVVKKEDVVKEIAKYLEAGQVFSEFKSRLRNYLINSDPNQTKTNEELDSIIEHIIRSGLTNPDLERFWSEAKEIYDKNEKNKEPKKPENLDDIKFEDPLFKGISGLEEDKEKSSSLESEETEIPVLDDYLDGGAEKKRQTKRKGNGLTKERYEELKEKIIYFRKTRELFARAEEGLSIRDLNKASLYIKRIKTEGKTEELEKEIEKLPGDVRSYLGSYERYIQARAEYVAEKTERALRDKKELAEAQTKEHAKGSFERIRKAWRWMGDVNLDTWATKEHKNRFATFVANSISERMSGRFGKFITRSISLKTGTSLALLGLAGTGGVFLGPGLGATALLIRRGLSGVGTTMGTYGLLTSAGEIPNTNITNEQISEMDLPALEEQMAIFETQARFSGKNVVNSKEYKALQQEWLKKTRESNNPELLEKISQLDDKLREKQIEFRKKDRTRKYVSLTVGAVFAGGLHYLDHLRSLGLSEVEASEVQEAVENSGVSPDQANNLIEGGSVIESASNLTPPIEPEILTEVSKEIIGTVEKGSNLWNTAKELVKNGQITEEQFREAWSSADSISRLPSGQTMHISELGLVHPGDQIQFVSGGDGVGAHFEVVDLASDKYHIGTNEDLANAFRAQDKPVPNWLQKSLGIVEEPKIEQFELDKVGLEGVSSSEVIAEVPIGSYDGSSLENIDFTVDGASDNLDVQLISGAFDWGKADVIRDNSGKIIRLDLRENIFVPRSRLVEEAAKEYLNPNFQEFIENSTNSQFGVNSNDALGEKIKLSKIIQAKEAAYKVSKLQDIFKAAQSRGDADLQRFARGQVVKLMNATSFHGTSFNPTAILKPITYKHE